MQITNFNEKPLKIGNVRLSWMDFVFIVICNISLLLVLINAILHHTGFWCHYPIFIMLYSYVIFIASISGQAKKFLARLRNGLLIVNLLFSITSVIHFIADDFNPNALIPIEWIIPIILTVTLIVKLCSLFFGSVTLLNIITAAAFMLPQATALFIVAIINPLLANGEAMYSDFSFIISIVNFALYVMVIINLAFLYFIKVKNKINSFINQ